MIWSSKMLHYAGINMNQGCVKGNSMNYDALIKHADPQEKMISIFIIKEMRLTWAMENAFSSKYEYI